MRNESHYIECLRDDFSNLEAELDRLRALNAKLVTALEALFKATIDGYLDRPEQVSALNQARAALAEARESQQPPQGLASDTA